MQYTMHLLSKEEVLKYWNLLEPKLDEAINAFNPDLLPFDICKWALNDRCSLWIHLDDNKDLVSVLCTQLETYPRSKYLNIIAMSGKIDDWDKWLPQTLTTLETFAAKHSANYVRIIGRKGWERKLQGHVGPKGTGYVTQQQVYELEL